MWSLTNLPEPQGARSTESPSKHSNLFTNLLRILALLAVIGITVLSFTIRHTIRHYEAYGYPGIFIISLLTHATILVPAPGIAFVFAMGSVLNPLLVGLVAGVGSAIGEIADYLAGFSGQAVVERTGLYAKIDPWVSKYGGWTILVLAAIPNPFFGLGGIAAGVSKMSFWRFLLFCSLGEIVKMTMFAYAGAYSVDWFAHLWR